MISLHEVEQTYLQRTRYS